MKCEVLKTLISHRVYSVEESRFSRSVFIRPNHRSFLGDGDFHGKRRLIIIHSFLSSLHKITFCIFLQVKKGQQLKTKCVSIGWNFSSKANISLYSTYTV